MTIVGDQPVEITHLRLTRGVNLIYGKNGVGKTKLLQAISSFFNDDFPEPKRQFQDANRKWISATKTDRCSFAFYGEGGVHIEAPFEFLGPEDALYRRFAGLTLDPLDDSLAGRDEIVGQIQDNWRMGNLTDQPTDDEYLQAERKRVSQSIDDWRYGWVSDVERSLVRERLAFALLEGASTPELTIDDCFHLVDAGNWFISRSRRLYACVPVVAEKLNKRLDISQAIGEWSKVLNVKRESIKNHRCVKDANSNDIEDIESASDLRFDEIGLVTLAVEGLPPPHPEWLGIQCPDWLSIPVAETNIRLNPFRLSAELRVVGDDFISGRVNRITSNWFAQWAKRVYDEYGRYVFEHDLISETGEQSEELKRVIAALSKRATDQFRDFFEDAPQLELRVSDPDDWFVSGAKFEWVVKMVGGRTHDVESLGSAHFRYAVYAIEKALDETNYFRPHDAGPKFFHQPMASIMVIDEPERALHRSAEATVMGALPNFAEYVIAATHSPKFIADGTANLTHLSRDDRGILKTSFHLGGLTASLKQTRNELAADLGIELSDLLSMTKVILLVEGVHDQRVIQFMCPEISEHVDVILIPISGTKELAGVGKSAFLISMTEAQVIVVTDNARADFLRQIEAKALERKSRDAEWRVQLLKEKENASREESSLIDLMFAAFEKNQESRIHVFGFSAKDIVHYLPAELISPMHSTWDELTKEFLIQHDQTRLQKGDGSRIKKWVKDVGGDYTIRGIDRAIRTLGARWGDVEGVKMQRGSEFTDLVELVQRFR